MCTFTFGNDELKTLLVHTLPKRDIEILGQISDIEGRTFSAAVRHLGKTFPESTAKAVLRKLVSEGLIICGNGNPIILTEFGKKIASMFDTDGNGHSNRQKSVGIIGGLGPETTAKVYSDIINGCRGLDGYPHIIIDSVPMPLSIEKAAVHGNIGDEFRKIIVNSAMALEASGADMIALPCNTACMFVDDVRRSVSIPIIDLPEEVLKELEERRIKVAGLLATPQTVRMYESKARKRNVKLVRPCDSDQTKISEIIIRTIRNEATDADKRTLRAITKKMASRGCEVIILGCTDLQLLGKDICELRTIDSMDVLVKRVCRIIAGSSSNDRMLVSKTNGGRSNRSDPTINKTETLKSQNIQLGADCYG